MQIINITYLSLRSFVGVCDQNTRKISGAIPSIERPVEKDISALKICSKIEVLLKWLGEFVNFVNNIKL